MSNESQADLPQRRTVLIVEDEEHVRRTLTLFLHWTGEWEVVGETMYGATAIALAHALRPELILLDLWLPDGNALKLIPTFQALAPTPRIVILTADDTESMEQQARLLGVDGYLLKTTPPDELLTMLRTIEFLPPESM